MVDRDIQPGATSALNVLLVEDDYFKQEIIRGVLSEAPPEVNVTIATSVRHAVSELQQDVFDLIVLDMSLPSRAVKVGGAQPISLPSGGVEVLLELAYDHRTDRVVIITQYPEIEFDGKSFDLRSALIEFNAKLEVRLIDVLYFEATDDIWKNRLRKMLR